MRFQLLGHVRAVAGGVAVELGPRKQRLVCALLALEVNRLVPVSRLIDLAWPEGPPASARAMIHTYVSGLRAILDRHGGAGAGVVLVRESAGYTLRCDPDRVDAHHFQRLVRQARHEADPERRTAVLDQALGLWRGPALAGVAVEATRARLCRHLDEARLAAIEDRAEALLRAGRHAALVDELIALAQEHPQRQRLTGQLMLALHRCGRADEALRVYERTRRELAEELGLDPGEDLQRLYRSILTDDAGLAAAPAPDTPAATGVAERRPAAVAPRQLPADVTGFAGRVDLLEHLDSLLPGEALRDGAPPEGALRDGALRDGARPAGGPPAVVISAIAGMAGVGKTALAVHWSHRAAEWFPDGQLYVDLRGFHPTGGPLEPAVAVRGFLDALDVPRHRIPSETDAQVALYRSLLAGRRMLVVLDNARGPEQVRPLLPSGGGCMALVTSRNRLEGLVALEGAHPLTIDVLSTVEARELLTRRLGADRVGAEPAAVDDLIALCGRLPLALAIAAARAATQPHLPLADLAAEVRDAHLRLSTLDAGDRQTDVSAVFSWSYQCLPAGPARLFRLLGLHPGPDIGVPAAASLAAVPAARARSLLAELARTHLVTQRAPGRYSSHDLLRLYAAERARALDSGPDRLAATRRVLDHYVHSSVSADRALYPSRDTVPVDPPSAGTTPEAIVDHDRALDWFTAEHRTLVSAVEHAHGARLDRHCWHLAWALLNFLERRGLWQDAIATQRLALDAARRLRDPGRQSTAARLLGRMYLRMGHLTAAARHVRTAIRLAEQVGDRVEQAHALVNLAQVLEQQSRYREALEHAHRALALYEAADHTLGRANALNTAGWFQAILGDYRAATAGCERALALHQEIGNLSGQASTLDSLGYVHHLLGRYDRAAAYYQRSADIEQDLGNRYGEADTLVRLGDTHRASGDPAAARDAWQRALAMLGQLGHPGADDVRAKLDALPV